MPGDVCTHSVLYRFPYNSGMSGSQPIQGFGRYSGLVLTQSRRVSIRFDQSTSCFQFAMTGTPQCRQAYSDAVWTSLARLRAIAPLRPTMGPAWLPSRLVSRAQLGRRKRPERHTRPGNSFMAA
jgi:hypothetical protein